MAQGCPGDSMVKNRPAVPKAQVHSPGWEDLLEKEMANYSTILAWESPWAKELGRLRSLGVTRVRHDLAAKPPPAIMGY